MSEEERCCKCGNDGFWEDYLFKFEGNIYCFDCLQGVLREERNMQVYKTTRYYTDDNQALGTDDDIDSAYEQICEYYDVVKIEME